MAGSWIEIDRKRLLDNVATFRKLLAKRCQLMAVVKANAYGHGALAVAPAIADHVDWFGVDSVHEALELGVTRSRNPILVLGHTALDNPDELDLVVERGLRQVLFRRDTAERLARAAGKFSKPARVHLKIETGLHRLGVPTAELASFARYLSTLDGLIVEGVYTHFADVEDPASSFYKEQLAALDDALDVLRINGIEPSLTHAFPTAGVLLHHPGEMTIARVGVGLFGVWPSAETRDAARARELDLHPVLSWKCRIAQIRTVPAGASVGYDRTFTAPSERRIAVIPVGYYDGLDRKLSGRGAVLVGGVCAPIVGRVAMNMTMIDVTDIPAEEDDEVTLIGQQGNESITAEEVGSWSGTIAYEVLARLARELPRTIG